MQYDAFYRRRLCNILLTTCLLLSACLAIPSDPTQAVEEIACGGRRTSGGGRKGVGGLVEGADRRAEETARVAIRQFHYSV